MKVRSMFRWGLLVSVALMVLLGFTPLWADLYYEMTTTEYSQTPGGESTKVDEQKGYIKSDRMKMEEVTDNQATIIRLDEELVWQVDHNAKTYSQITFAELEALSGQQEAAMKEAQEQMEEMKEMLESMPPEQRAMMEQQMQQAMQMQSAMSEPPKVTKTGKKEKILGYTCEEYKFEWGPINWDMWTCEEVVPDIDFSRFYQGFEGAKAMTEELAKIKGFPLKTIMTTGMAGTTTRNTSVVTKIKTERIKSSEFELPKGYRQVSHDQWD
jgi:hypothetical protein